jgi:hypothetical protein
MATENRDTLNQVITQLEAIATAHYQINSFGFGNIYDITTSGDITYPLMWVMHDGVDISQGFQNFKFDVIICDIVKGGRVNETEVLSDQLEIVKDVVAQLKHQDYPWDFTGDNIVLTAFDERFPDSVTGYSFTITLQLEYDSNRCSIPTSNVVITSGGSASTGTGSAGGTIYVYVNGVLKSTTTSTNLDAETVNITWT